MAIAFVRANPISRQKGQSVVASAAYRACESLLDLKHEKIQDYTGKGGHIDGGLILPDGVQFTREELWNGVEAFEKRVDARLAKEIMVALPKELTLEENIALSKEIAALVSREQKNDGQEDQYCVDWNMHEPHKEAATDEEGNYLLDENGKKIMENNENIHLHILVTERSWDFEKGTFRTKKDRDRNSKEWMEGMKLKIGELMNKRLREKGIQEVDFRSFEVRNEDSKQKTGMELAAPQVHRGPERTNRDRKRRRRINRTKRELKMVQDELLRIQKKEKESSKSSNSVHRIETVKPDLSSWTKKIPADAGVKKTVSETKTAESTPAVSASVPSAVHNPAAKPETSKPASVYYPSSANVGSQKSGSANKTHAPKTRCLLCGIIEYPECKKCKFREENKGISEDSGYSR